MPPERSNSKNRSRVLLKEIEALSMLPRTPTRASGRSRRCARARDEIRGELYADADAVAARARRAPSEPAEHARLHRAPVHRLRRAARRPPLRRRPRHRAGFAELPGPAGRCVVGHQKGARHEAEDLPQLRLRAARRLPQGAARRCSWREKFRRPIVVFVDTPAAYPGHRVGGARRRRGDRRQPARDDDARDADRRHRHAARAAAAARSASPSAIAC